MNIVVVLIAVITSILFLYLFTLIVAFYHCFESNKDKMDKYALIAAIVLGLLFILLMRGVVLR